MESRLPRKLSVILHADVVGYSRLAGEHGDTTHRQLKATFTRAFKIVSSYNGRIANTAGDAFLAVFESAADAVCCAVDIQQDQARNRDPEQQGLAFRIGINLGDIIEDDGDVFGDGVNIAARIESLADTGGICVSESVHSAIGKLLPLEFADLGPREFKNISDPIRIFAVQNVSDIRLPESEARESGAKIVGGKKNLGLVIGSLAVIGLLAALFMFPLKTEQPREKDIETNNSGAELQGIAILPFKNLNGDPEEDYFSDGITEDLITDISKSSDLLVISRNTAFTYKNKTVEAQNIASELGVRYVLEGSVRRAGNQVRINAQLVDTETGGHLWAERYDGKLEDVFGLQDQVTAQIVQSLSLKLSNRDGQDDLNTNNPDAHDAYLQGLSYYLRNTPQANARSEAYFLEAIKHDPAFKRAHAALAKVYYKAGSKEYALALGMFSRKAIFLAHYHLQKIGESKISDVNVVRSQMALDKHQVNVALDESNIALDINPNNVDALKAKSKALIYSGQFDAGKAIAEEIMRLDPAALAEPLYLIALADFAHGDYGSSHQNVTRAIDNDPATAIYYGLLASALGKLGHVEDAAKAWQQYKEFWIRVERHIWIAAAVYLHPFEERSVSQHLAEGMKAAGGVERPPSLYLKLDRETRLTGSELQSLVFRKSLKGEDFWRKTLWHQDRSDPDQVVHTGEPIHVVGLKYDHDEKFSRSWIDDDKLCHEWLVSETTLSICEQVYRDADRGNNAFYMVTDLGPHPFEVLN